MISLVQSDDAHETITLALCAYCEWKHVELFQILSDGSSLSVMTFCVSKKINLTD